MFTLTTPSNSKHLQKGSVCSNAHEAEEPPRIKQSEDEDTQKEVKMTLMLLSFVAAYVILTVPCNITLIYWTLFPEVYVSFLL